jgi:hypothetical protein
MSDAHDAARGHSHHVEDYAARKHPGFVVLDPARKLYYNLAITGLSVAVALLVGTVELLAVATEKLGLTGAFWRWVSSIDLNNIGYVIVGLFLLTWMLAIVIWRESRSAGARNSRAPRRRAGPSRSRSTGSEDRAATATSLLLAARGTLGLDRAVATPMLLGDRLGVLVPMPHAGILRVVTRRLARVQWVARPLDRE